MNRKSPTPRHIIIKMPNLKTAREKQELTYKGALIRLAAYLSTTDQERMARNIPSSEKQRPTTKTTLPSKALNQNGRQNRSFPDKRELKEYTPTKPVLKDMQKGLL